MSFATPLNNESFVAGASIGAVINAADSNGSISNVRLYIDGSFVRQESFDPYEWGISHPSVSDPALENLAAGTYSLIAQATDNDGNIKEDSISVTVTGANRSHSSTSIDGLTGIEKQLVLYPNPTSSMVNIFLENQAKDTPVIYGIFTILGTHVKTVYGGTEERINIKTLAPGIYLVKAKTPKRDYTSKLIIE